MNIQMLVAAVKNKALIIIKSIYQTAVCGLSTYKHVTGVLFLCLRILVSNLQLDRLSTCRYIDHPSQIPSPATIPV